MFLNRFFEKRKPEPEFFVRKLESREEKAKAAAVVAKTRGFEDPKIIASITRYLTDFYEGGTTFGLYRKDELIGACAAMPVNEYIDRHWTERGYHTDEILSVLEHYKISLRNLFNIGGLGIPEEHRGAGHSLLLQKAVVGEIIKKGGTHAMAEVGRQSLANALITSGFRHIGRIESGLTICYHNSLKGLLASLERKIEATRLNKKQKR